MGYYIANQGLQQGPFELHDLLQKGLRLDSLVWTEGMAEWKRAQDLPHIIALLQGQVQPNGPAPLQPLQSIPYNTTIVAPTNGMAVASLVLGIVSIFPFSCAYGIGIITAIL